jgi:hypothetical protein
MRYRLAGAPLASTPRVGRVAVLILGVCFALCASCGRDESHDGASPTDQSGHATTQTFGGSFVAGTRWVGTVGGALISIRVVSSRPRTVDLALATLHESARGAGRDPVQIARARIDSSRGRTTLKWSSPYGVYRLEVRTDGSIRGELRRADERIPIAAEWVAGQSMWERAGGLAQVAVQYVAAVIAVNASLLALLGLRFAARGARARRRRARPA